MDEVLRETLARAAEQTFEGLAFMFALSPDEPPSPEPPSAAASVAFGGPFSGTLIVSVADVMLPQLAANMLGLDDGAEPSPDKQHDALKELANVVCGHFLPLLAGPTAVFDVEAPRFLADDPVPASCRGRAPSAVTRLSLDAGQAVLALFIDDLTQPSGDPPG
jgi:CheY-specific phosphatase CheX